MGVFIGLGLLLLLLPMNLLFLVRVKKMSVYMTNMYVTVSLLMGMFVILLYTGIVIWAFKPDITELGIGIFLSIFFNLCFKIGMTLKNS